MLRFFWIFLGILLINTLACQHAKKIPMPKPSDPEILSCDHLKPDEEFNGLRLKVFQDFLNTFFQKIKSQPVTPANTEKMAFIERMRRRTSWPILSVKLRDNLMTETLHQEMDNLIEFLRSRPPLAKEDEETLQKMNSELRLKIEDVDSWKCPVKVVLPETPPPIPPLLQEKDPSGQPQTIIFDGP